MLRAGLEPATCRLGVDNRSRSGPQQEVRRGREMRSGRGVEPQRRTTVQPLSPDNRAASARDDLLVGAGPPGVEPGPARLELVMLPLHHGPVKADDPDRTGLPGVALRCSSV